MKMAIHASILEDKMESHGHGKDRRVENARLDAKGHCVGNKHIVEAVHADMEVVNPRR